MVQNIMKISLKIKLFSLFFMFFFLHLNVAHAVPALPGRAVPMEGIFNVPAGSNSYLYDENIAIITRPQTSQVGSIFSTLPNKIDLSQDFSTSMLMYFGNRGTEAADGMAFVIHADERRIDNFTGATGDSLGVYARTGQLWNASSGTQIMNSFAVEFDTFHNGSGLDQGVNANNNHGHVAWSFPGVELSYTKKTGILTRGQIDRLVHNDTYYPSTPLSNNGWHTFTVDWVADSRQLNYSFDGNRVTVDIPYTIFNTNDVFWGFTGSTGGQYQESAVAFTQVPGLVNLEKKFEVLNNEGVGINGETVKAKETATVNFDFNYLGGHQDLIDPKVIFELSDNSQYKEGSLKLNGRLVDDTDFIANGYSFSFPNLTTDNNVANFSFEIEHINETDEEIGSSVAAHLDAKNFLSGTFSSDFTIGRRLNILNLDSAQSSIEFSGAEMDLISIDLTNDEILEKIKDKAGVVVTASDDDLVGINIINSYEAAFRNLKRLAVNISYSFELIAVRGEEKSEPIAINITHTPGSFNFHSNPTTIAFEEQLGTSSSKLYKARPDSALSIGDTRTYTSQWTLQVSATTLENEDGRPLQGEFKYLNETGSITINATMQPIRTEKQGFTGPSIVDISTDWSAEKGLVFETSNANYLGTYRGTMNWLLSDAP